MLSGGELRGQDVHGQLVSPSRKTDEQVSDIDKFVFINAKLMLTYFVFFLCVIMLDNNPPKQLSNGGMLI